MNKTDLIDAIAKESGLSKVDSKKALNGFLTAVTKELKKGGKVTLVGFGTYQVVEKKARTGVNPQTKKPIKIAAKKVVKFKPGADLVLKK
ncbi:MAG: HU family DNA-binding protein [Dysgonamonadaceae bacterium]|jgi:DNA-binding protein HU-beta|nr:HU family DNA-binding protein [Dysgonamonadaceae bacterium]